MESYMRHSSSGLYDQHQAYSGDGPLQEASEHSSSLPHLLHYAGRSQPERVDRDWYRTASNERQGARTDTTVSLGSQWYRSEGDPATGESQSMNTPEVNELGQRQAPPLPQGMPAAWEGGGGRDGDGGVVLTLVEGGSSEADRGNREEHEHVYSNPASRGMPESEAEGVHESAWKTAGIIGWLILLSLVYVFEVISDIAAAVDLGLQGRFGAMAVCGGLVLIPAALLAVLSLGLYKRDDNYYILVDPSYERRFGKLSLLLHCMLLGPVHRYFKVALVASIHKSQFFEHIKRDSDLIRYIALMLYTAPQLTLYFSLLLVYSAEGLNMPLTITVSATISAASALLVLWSFAANDMLSSREVRQTVAAKVTILNWNAFIIAARVVALGAFASNLQFGLYVFAVAGVHWMVMWIWVALQRPVLGEDSNTQSEENGKGNGSAHGNASSPGKLKRVIIKLFWVYYYVIVGMVQLFTFYNIKSGRTRYRLTFYYVVVAAESLGLVLVYHVWRLAWPSPLIVTLECSTLAIGVTWMLLYYSILHPTKTEGWSKLGIPPFCCPLCRSHVNTYDFHDASTADSAHDSDGSSAVGVSAVGPLDRMHPVTAAQRYTNRFSTGSYNEQLSGSLITEKIAVEPDYTHFLTQMSFVSSEQKQEVASSSPSHSFPQSLPPPLHTTGSAATTVASVRRDSTVEVTV